MEILKSSAPIDVDDLAEVENKTGVKLPPGYRSFLLKHNGGCPRFDEVQYDNEYFDTVGHFYAVLNECEYDDLVRQIREYEGKISKDYLPIAESPGGNVFCISLKSEEYGYVYHWDHETANYDGEPWDYNMTCLSTSFEEFLNNLKDGD